MPLTHTEMAITGLLRPWQSARLGWSAVALSLIAGVPLFVCMPPWTDATLYDVAARNILRGGVHYRDVFDTNLPGMVWATAAIRSIAGWSCEGIRIADLLIVGGSVAILVLWLKRAGASAEVQSWFVAAVALFYPFTSEFNHCQRDPWMLLPAALGGLLRLRQIAAVQTGERASLRRSMIEGFLWGLAIWLKPHVLVPAAFVWLVSVRLARKDAIRDLLGLLTGGLICGVPGIVWLVASGTWPHFWDIFANWNPEYLREGVWSEIPEKFLYLFWCFQPWGLIHFAALPLAAWSLLAGRTNNEATSPLLERPAHARAILAALYLGWVAQAVILQKGFDYVQVPPMLLALAVLASRGWCVGFPFAVWYAVLGVACLVPSIRNEVRAFNATSPIVQVDRHPLTNPRMVQLWPRCWRERGSPELRNELGQFTHVHCAANWVELEAVAQFLRTVEPPIRDRELTCWHDSTHPLYLMLDLEPSTRYLHFGTVFALRGKVEGIRVEVAGSPQRYAVSDLRRMTYHLGKAYAPGERGPLSLPDWFPSSERDRFPWNRAIVFRSGRYFVHRIDRHPKPEEIDIPDWSNLKD